MKDFQSRVNNFSKVKLYSTTAEYTLVYIDFCHEILTGSLQIKSYVNGLVGISSEIEKSIKFAVCP